MNEARWGMSALALLLVGAGMLAWGLGGDATAALVTGILVVVLGLACLRARSWIRKTRALTQVGLDLHVSEDP